ncbi:outer membrane beta-barrel protein [Algoriphagus sp. A40]|uniref:outer membrane beta-barrel protein n=1 Tax=Algoriphagus sp. A40 TaxID=1945863 RepID=UPI000984482A|nr:outer membrane beta-barrel protein [Algoriphagus sp. A40]OOG75294.1 hypothetical protein B0E43_09930 [Algoriphagus sp. A40]
MKKLFTLSLAILAFQFVQAQDSENKPKTPIGGRPNIPSDLNFEFGFNQLTNRPADLGIDFFGSRTFNVSYQFPINLFGKGSGFTLNPGIGVGSDKLEFNDNENLFINTSLGANSSKLVDVTDVYGENIIVKTNNFAANYFEVPIEIRYHLNKNNYSKSFRVSIGGKVGYLYEAHTKVKYESAAFDKRKIKDSQNYGLEKVRYAVSVKAGSPGFYVWGNFFLNDVWQAGRGPYATQASQVNFGLAVTVF